MAVTIKRLNCRVRVDVGQGEVRPMQAGGPQRPLVQAASPMGEAQAQRDPTPAEKASEQVGPMGEMQPQGAGRVDPAMVAKRVQELMIEEARIAQERGER